MALRRGKRLAALALLATLGSSGDDILKAAQRRFIRIEIDDHGTGVWREWCGGMLVGERNPSATRKVLTAAHCLYDLGAPRYGQAALRAVLPDGEMATLDRAALGRLGAVGGLAAQGQAVVMDFAFADLGQGTSPASAGVPPDLRPLALSATTRATILSPYGVHVCRVASPCGSQFDLVGCDREITIGVSGSPVWTSWNGRPVVIGLVTKHHPGGATSFTAVLARNSFLSANPAFSDHDMARSAFVARFAGNPNYRLPRDTEAPHCARSTRTLVSTSTLPMRDDHLFTGAAFLDDSDILSWDRRRHALCTISDAAPTCQPVALGPLSDRLVRGVHRLSGTSILLTLGGGGAAVLERDRGTGPWNVSRRIDGGLAPGAAPGTRRTLLTHGVNGGFLASNGDLIVYGESALCAIRADRCDFARYPSGDPARANFTVRSAFELSPGRILAVGRDFPGEQPQCILYGLQEGHWMSVRRCQHFDRLYGGINAALPFRDGALAFSSSGKALMIGPDLKGRHVPIEGLIGTTLGNPDEVDDSIRAARWVVRDKLVAIAGSNGAFHLLRVDERSDGLRLVTDRCLWSTDLGLWLVSMDVRGQNAAVVSQAGELYRLRLPTVDAVDRFLSPSTYTGQCS